MSTSRICGKHYFEGGHTTMEEHTKFEDGEGFSYNPDKDRMTFRDIILQHLKKITTLASVEMMGGYWQIKETPLVLGNASTTVTSKIYIPDTRECYSNAIEVFSDMLLPYFDKEMKKAEEESSKELEEAYNNTTIEQSGHRIFKKSSDQTEFRDQRVLINRQLFRALCCFLYRKKYLELGTLEN